MTCTCDAQEGTLPHEDFCEEAPITKREVVEMIENGSGSIIDDYLFWIEEDCPSEEAKEAAVNSAIESVSCFLELGSCRGGGCKH